MHMLKMSNEKLLTLVLYHKILPPFKLYATFDFNLRRKISYYYSSEINLDMQGRKIKKQRVGLMSNILQ